MSTWLCVAFKMQAQLITFLGRIYCDIRTTRLCIFGLLFGCMKQTIVMAAVIQQEKSLFQENLSYVDPVKLRYKFNFAGDSDSDLVMYYNAYSEWHRHFIQHQELSNPSFYELKDRFEGFGLNSELVSTDIYAQPGITPSRRELSMKLAIAGAFYPRYVKPHHIDMKMVKQEEQKRVAGGMQRPHAVNLCETKGAPKKFIQNYFEQFGTIERLEQRDTNCVLE